MKTNGFEDFFWQNQPRRYLIEKNTLTILTEPETDLWQRTYSGIVKANAPAFLINVKNDFTFSVKTEFEDSYYLQDQCGVLMYIDNENWFTVSVEYQNRKFSRLGAVVTNMGYSDQATSDIPAGVSEMYYRVSRRNQDFFIENSLSGKNFRQMRILHLHKKVESVNIGVYACSPLKSTFKAFFSKFKIEECAWPQYFPL
jgi:regulation of enolase protein 1 (concanavalin A-like superfamily)